MFISINSTLLCQVLFSAPLAASTLLDLPCGHCETERTAHNSMPAIKGKTITVGVTGASGAVFAQKTLAMLERDPRGGRVDLVVTENGQRLFAEELKITSGDLQKLPGRVLGRTPKKIVVISNKDVGA